MINSLSKLSIRRSVAAPARPPRRHAPAQASGPRRGRRQPQAQTPSQERSSTPDPNRTASIIQLVSVSQTSADAKPKRLTGQYEVEEA